jgi:hypothetical protein
MRKIIKNLDKVIFFRNNRLHIELRIKVLHSILSFFHSFILSFFHSFILSFLNSFITHLTRGGAVVRRGGLGSDRPTRRKSLTEKHLH